MSVFIGNHMTRGEIMEEYRRLNSEDQKAFHRWLITNTVVGAISLLALITVISMFSGRDAGSVTAGNAGMTAQAQAR